MNSSRGLAAILKPSVSDTVTDAEAAVRGEAEIRMSLVSPVHSFESVGSPAIDLQRKLQAQLNADYDLPEVEKYPPALTIMGTVLFCSACWYGLFHLLF